MSELKNWFSLTIGDKDREFLLARIKAHDPAILTKNQGQQEESVCDFTRRHLFNGKPNKPDCDTAGNALNLDNGIVAARWLEEWADLNEGLGPRILCGPMMRVYGAYMALLGHYTRMVGATGPKPEGSTVGASDNQAEFWNTAQKTWVFRNVGCGILYRHKESGLLLDYLSMSQLARNGEGTKFTAVSPTGGQALHPGGDFYGQWDHFLRDAAISNGNGAFLGQPHDWKMLRVWPPAAGTKTVWLEPWIEENPPKNLLYPDMSEAA